MRYAAPGVYVREVANGIRPLSPVGTSTAAFIGAAATDDRRDVAVAVYDWSQFVRLFASNAAEPADHLTLAVAGFFDNGGSRCYVVNTAATDPLSGRAPRSALRALDAIDDVSIIAAPGRSAIEDHAALVLYCESDHRRDCVAILDPPSAVDDVLRLAEVATAATGSTTATGLRPPSSEFATLYFPWLVVADPLTGQRVEAPPSGHVAGIWARTDALRGVHKAPANEVVRGALGLTYQVARQEQELLNPAGVNCIRAFPREGIKIWGARTLAEESSEFRYLNVRRLVTMLRETIVAGTRWIVFEPNDERLWNSVVCNVSAFLTQVWRDGALMGPTPGDAFFVKCDAETNPPEIRDAGQVVAVVGIAPVKPAEFVVFEIAQHHTESIGAGRGADRG